MFPILCRKLMYLYKNTRMYVVFILFCYLYLTKCSSYLILSYLIKNWNRIFLKLKQIPLVGCLGNFHYPKCAINVSSIFSLHHDTRVISAVLNPWDKPKLSANSTHPLSVLLSKMCRAPSSYSRLDLRLVEFFSEAWRDHDMETLSASLALPQLGKQLRNIYRQICNIRCTKSQELKCFWSRLAVVFAQSIEAKY